MNKTQRIAMLSFFACVIFLMNIFVVSGFDCGTDTIQDIEGNTYNTVEIDTQCWMKENMRTTKYPDGTSITKGCATHIGCGGTGALLWGDDTALYSCPPNTASNEEDCNAAYPNGIDATPAGGTTGTGEELGLLYQWSAIMNSSITEGAQGICPSGWHIPKDAEWMILEEYLDLCSGTDTGCSGATGLRGTTEGDELKKSGLDPNICYDTTPPCGTSGFEALLAGNRATSGAFYNRGASTFLWSSLESSTSAWRRVLFSGSARVTIA